MPIRRSRRSTLRKLRPFQPPVPIIMTGKFEGRAVNELADHELKAFAAGSARSQVTYAIPGFLPDWPAYWPDHSHYWCARFELERRSKEVNPPRGPVISVSDSIENIATKLANYAYRLAAKSHHPDLGGDKEVFLKLEAAHKLLLAVSRKGQR